MDNFKNTLNNTELFGTFVKTPHPHIIEVLALAELSFIVLDAEHAPFDRSTLDSCILAARANQLPCIVRVQDSQPSTILNALDCGATGIQIPHVCSAEQAEKLVKMSHYGEGGRGYAGSSRAAKYATKPMANHLKDSQNNTVVIAQIEDPEGVVNAESIAKVEGIDVSGPLAFDLIMSPQAAATKKLTDDPVAGHADAIIVPDIVSGNALFKAFVYLTGGCAADEA